MRMIDNFRTPVERGMIEALERIVMGTAADISHAMGQKPRNDVVRHHTKSLIRDEIIHVCGHVGIHNHPVYALVNRRMSE